MKEPITTGRRRKYKSLICKVYPTIRAPSALHLQADLYQATFETLIQESSPSSQLFKNGPLPTANCPLPTDFTFFPQHSALSFSALFFCIPDGYFKPETGKIYYY